jgi:hypothetical protein
MKTTNWFSKCTALRSELELTRASLKDCLAQRDRYHSDLAAAEMRLDRLQSRTVQVIHGRAQSPPREVVVKEEEGVEEKEVEPKEEPRMSSSPAVSGQFIGGSVSNFTSTRLILNQPTSALVPATPTFGELQEWQDIAKVREDKIRELESLNENLRHENRILTVCIFVFHSGKPG